MTGARVAVAVTGGIACYKCCALVSRLAQSGAAVTVLMTPAAERFVTPLTFESLSGRPVHRSLWEQADHHESAHVALARGCDLVIVAPATANTLAKLAHGLADNVVTTALLALPRDTPVLLAPAMNEQMWENPITRDNLARLVDRLGYHTVGPETGWQACRTSGAGRMSEPDDIVNAAAALLTARPG